MNISVIGSGYVGTTTAVVLASLNYHVIGVDVDRNKIQQLNAGKLPFTEPGLDEMLTDALDRKSLSFTDNYRAAVGQSEVIIIAVPTPSGVDGKADLQFFRSAAQSIARAVNGHKVIVTKSTVPIGTNRWLSSYLKEELDDPELVDVVSNPEFLREGSAVHDMLFPDRIVIGGENAAAIDTVSALFKSLASPRLIANWETTELIKYASNAFLATKISFINEIARIADRVGADITKVALGMGMDPRIGRAHLRAGMGYGGSCFPKDVKALIATAREAGVDSDILEAVRTVNETQYSLYLARLQEYLGDHQVEPWVIAILGLTFKPLTDDLRESSALRVIEALLPTCGEIRIVDPTIHSKSQTPWPLEQKVVVCHSPDEALRGADAGILCTDWDIFGTISWKDAVRSMRHPIVVDGCNLYDPRDMLPLGVTYIGVGRGDKA